MNNFQIQSFVRQIIAEAKAKKEEPKKDKKDIKKPEAKKAKKTSGSLVEMKEDLAKLKEKLSKINDLIADWESLKSSANKISYGGESDIEIGADKKEDIMGECDAEINKLKKEKESIEKEMANLKEATSSEINKIKEMMGLVKKGEKKDKMVDEKLKPSMGAGAYVKDFKKSDAPQFKGKSKAKKQDMAVAAYLSAKDKKK